MSENKTLKTIDSAPKDGTIIVGYEGGSDPFLCRFKEDRWRVTVTTSEAADDWCFPTHWAPFADTPSVQSAQDTVRRQKAIDRLNACLDFAKQFGGSEIILSLEDGETALRALKDKVLIPYIGEVSGELPFRKTLLDHDD